MIIKQFLSNLTSQIKVTKWFLIIVNLIVHSYVKGNLLTLLETLFDSTDIGYFNRD